MSHLRFSAHKPQRKWMQFLSLASLLGRKSDFFMDVNATTSPSTAIQAMPYQWTLADNSPGAAHYSIGPSIWRRIFPSGSHTCLLPLLNNSALASGPACQPSRQTLRLSSARLLFDTGPAAAAARVWRHVRRRLPERHTTLSRPPPPGRGAH